MIFWGMNFVVSIMQLRSSFNHRMKCYKLILLNCICKNCSVNEHIWYPLLHQRSERNTSGKFSAKKSDGEKSVGQKFRSANISFGENSLRRKFIGSQYSKIYSTDINKQGLKFNHIISASYLKIFYFSKFCSFHEKCFYIIFFLFFFVPT